MLRTSYRNYAECVKRVIVVIQPDDDAHELLPSTAEVTVAADAHKGMGHSLSAGIESVASDSWVLVGLADMPWVMASTIRTIGYTLKSKPTKIVRPYYRGQAGHPVGFGQRFLGDLKQLQGDSGAKSLIDANSDALVKIDINDPGVVGDVDFVADLSR